MFAIVCVRCYKEDMKTSSPKFKAVRAALEDGRFSNEVRQA